jgi:UDP-N-acetylmuramoylalanine--D-glutamate ligase
MDWLNDLPVLVLGLGDSGLAMARWCARHGARVTVWDSRDEPPGAAALAAEWPAVQRIGGTLGVERLAGVQLVLKSPGLAPHDARVAPLLQEARDIGIAVLGELELFVRALADLKAERAYVPQLLAITGTNGKTTTTAMTALLVARAGRSVVAAGNIGPTLLDTLTARLHALPEVWVLELSSFQLDSSRGFEPDAATVLNITQDHLDWHGTMAAYTAAKARAFGSRSVLVINRDDAIVEAMIPVPVPVAAKAKPKPAALTSARTVVRFGLGAPQHPGDFGVVEENGMTWLVRALPAEEGASNSRSRRSSPSSPSLGSSRGDVGGEREELHLQRLMPADALRVRGRHNAANALAALALATAIGCPLAPMLHGLREYAGEPHRVQFVASVDGVEAYDDSKGTNVGATVAAITGLGADKAPGKLVVILGGDGKGQDFAPLAPPLALHARAVATIGRDAAAIEAALEVALGHALGDALRDAPGDVPGDEVLFQRHATLDAAVAWCFAQARPGDAVLLSPACASLDMFRNYAHRAEVFVQAVQALAAERGVVA